MRALCTSTETLYYDSGLPDIFNAALGRHLLYKIERPQYNRILKEAPLKFNDAVDERNLRFDSRKSPLFSPAGVRNRTDMQFAPSRHYGFIHLVRMFVRIGNYLASTSFAQNDTSIVRAHMHHILAFLDANAEK